MNRDKIIQYIEKWYPLTVASLGGLAAWNFGFTLPIDSRKDIISGSLTFVAISLGFLATSKTIMIGYKDNPSYIQLQEKGYIGALSGYLVWAIYTSLLTSVLLLVMYFCDNCYLDYMYFFAIAISIISFYRVLRNQIILLSL